MKDTFPPDIADCRERLEARRDNFRREGYEHYITRIALEVQEGGSPEERKEMTKAIADMRNSEANCYAAARRLQQEIDAFPAAAEGEREG